MAWKTSSLLSYNCLIRTVVGYLRLVTHQQHISNYTLVTLSLQVVDWLMNTFWVVLLQMFSLNSGDTLLNSIVWGDACPDTTAVHRSILCTTHHIQACHVLHAFSHIGTNVGLDQSLRMSAFKCHRCLCICTTNPLRRACQAGRCHRRDHSHMTELLLQR